jgi:fatty acid desaturase|tara:strand:+ start:1586 stop:1744 length:159 start_codon:yes stop_codon:yes gene_type:complete
MNFKEAKEQIKKDNRRFFWETVIQGIILYGVLFLMGLSIVYWFWNILLGLVY